MFYNIAPRVERPASAGHAKKNRPPGKAACD